MEGGEKRQRPFWIWYPGQQAAHLHRRAVLHSLGRCTHVGYPMGFRNPVNNTFFRLETDLEHPCTVNWIHLGGRVRVRANGTDFDVTSDRATLGAGHLVLQVAIDFSDTLPAFFMEGPGLCTDGSWETSLDGKNWVAAEYDEEGGNPLDSREHLVSVGDLTLLSVENGRWDGNCLSLEDGDAIFSAGRYDLLEVSFHAVGEGSLDVRVGQSIREVRDARDGELEQAPLRPISLSGQGKRHTLDLRCGEVVRFSVAGSAQIKDLSVKALTGIWDKEAEFSCDDESFTTLWEMCKATVRSCAHDFYLDAIYRDGLPWALDGAVGIRSGDYLFFDDRLARNTALSQSLPAGADTEDLGGGYLDFPLHSILCFLYYIESHEKTDFLQTYAKRIYEILDLYDRMTDRYGFLNAQAASGKEFFVEWGCEASGLDLVGAPTYAQILYWHCLHTVSLLARSIGDEREAMRYGRRAERLRRQIGAMLYDRDTGLYYNGIDRNGNVDRAISIYAQTFGATYGLLDERGFSSLASMFWENPEYVRKNYSLAQYWEVEALILSGRGDLLKAHLDRVWGSCLKKGYSRIPEDIRPDDDEIRSLAFYGRPYGESLCHLVMAGPFVIACVEAVMGMVSLESGHRVCRFSPLDIGLSTFSGSFLTKRGRIGVLKDRDGWYEISLPAGVKVLLDGFRTDKGETVIGAAGLHRVRRISS